jgi:hypothetical protein
MPPHEYYQSTLGTPDFWLAETGVHPAMQHIQDETRVLVQPVQEAFAAKLTELPQQTPSAPDGPQQANGRICWKDESYLKETYDFWADTEANEALPEGYALTEFGVVIKNPWLLAEVHRATISFKTGEDNTVTHFSQICLWKGLKTQRQWTDQFDVKRCQYDYLEEKRTLHSYGGTGDSYTYDPERDHFFRSKYPHTLSVEEYFERVRKIVGRVPILK